jgi:hypothetical protein
MSECDCDERDRTHEEKNQRVTNTAGTIRDHHLRSSCRNFEADERAVDDSHRSRVVPDLDAPALGIWDARCDERRLRSVDGQPVTSGASLANPETPRAATADGTVPPSTTTSVR